MALKHNWQSRVRVRTAGATTCERVKSLASDPNRSGRRLPRLNSYQ